MSLAKYGPFASVFEQGELLVPGHLELLHLDRTAAQVVFDRIELAIEKGDPTPWLTVMLTDGNWRPNLVGAIALAMLPRAFGHSKLIWQAVSRGSWVSPQLIAAAFFVDSNFGKSILRQFSSISSLIATLDFESNESNDSRFRFVCSRHAKPLAAMVSFCESTPELEHCIQAYRKDPLLEKLRALDEDDSADIALSWKSQLQIQFAKRGVILTPVWRLDPDMASHKES